ncbi:MAG: hypothetical protein GY860_17945, partial [Desulfobacteraceae bacterium]|nr:hypothetical protein [Desulfobacteraceae bacterium]
VFFLKKILDQVKQCCDDYNIKINKDVVVGLSGGKDSTLLTIILYLLDYNVVPVIVDLGYKNFNAYKIKNRLSTLVFDPIIIEANNKNTLRQLYPDVAEKVNRNINILNNQSCSTPCSACSQVKRTLLFEHAKKANIKYIAYGHHRNDLITTIMKDYFVACYLLIVGLWYLKNVSLSHLPSKKVGPAIVHHRAWCRQQSTALSYPLASESPLVCLRFTQISLSDRRYRSILH